MTVESRATARAAGRHDTELRAAELRAAALAAPAVAPRAAELDPAAPAALPHAAELDPAGPAARYATDDARWDALVRRDAGADGAFLYSVRTTGVYCRPSCAARLPRRENVAFHATRDAAVAAGFRACRRCRPDEPPLAQRWAATVAAACRRIESADTPPALDTLATEAGMSPFHFHRVFKATTGLTPRAYADAHRQRRVRDRLAGARTVTEAIYDAGYGSSTRFYAGASAALGMSAKRFRAGGRGEVLRFAVGQCSLGAVLVAASERGVCAILLGDDPDALVRELQDRFPAAELVGGDATFEHWVARVVALVESPGAATEQLPLDVRGTAFQRRVWDALRSIPAGATASYTDIARRIGAPSSTRAVAGACAANPVAIAIPCHRVVRTDGALSGYRWGIERKRELLAREARALAAAAAPR